MNNHILRMATTENRILKSVEEIILPTPSPVNAPTAEVTANYPVHFSSTEPSDKINSALAAHQSLIP
jgi:hypothetical protein